MGKRGPAPTPAAVLKLRGTYRPDRDAPNAPTPEPKAPACPAWVGADVPWGKFARQRYRELAPQLVDIGVLTEVDRDAFIQYCDAFARWRYWRAELGRLGTWNQETATGYLAQRPEVGYANRALDDMRKWGALFGLSPSDRRNVSATPQEQGDPAEDFLFGGRRSA